MQNVAVPAQGKGLAFWGHEHHPAQSTREAPTHPALLLLNLLGAGFH